MKEVKEREKSKERSKDKPSIKEDAKVEKKVKQEEEPAETPLLFIDINLGEEKPERIIVYEGDSASQLAKDFCDKHGLDEETKEKLEE